MYVFAPGQIFAESIGGQAVQIADIPNLRFEIQEAATDPKSGDFKTLVLSDPVYQPANELSDDAPLSGLRVAVPLPAYPSDISEATAAFLVTTSELALDVWVQRSRANMTHLCPMKPKPGQSKPVKPLYRIEIGLSLRYKLKVDTEQWARTQDSKTKVFGPWKKSRVDEGKAVQRLQGIYWSNRCTLQTLVEQTPCIDLPEGQPRDSWLVEEHKVVRTFVLPYFPGVPIPKPDKG